MDILITEDICDADSECTVTAWLFDDGDEIEQGAAIAEIMIDKAQLEFPAPVSGVLRIKVEVEQPLKQGDVIATIE